MFDGQCRQFSLGIFQNGEWSGERVGDGNFWIDDSFVFFRPELADFCRSGFQQAAGLRFVGSGLFGAAR